MKKILVLAAALPALFFALPRAEATPAMSLAPGLKAAAGTSSVEQVRCRRYWVCRHHHCRWVKRCW